MDRVQQGQRLMQLVGSFGNSIERVWYYKVKPTLAGPFVAWCAQTEVLGDGPLQVDPREVVFFRYGPTPEHALAQLKLEVEAL